MGLITRNEIDTDEAKKENIDTIFKEINGHISDENISDTADVDVSKLAISEGEGIDISAAGVISGEDATAANKGIASFHEAFTVTAGDVSNRIRLQEDTTDFIANPDQIIQMGWGRIQGDGTDGIAETVTFPSIFNASGDPSKIIVVVTSCGLSVTSTNEPTQALGAIQNIIAGADTIAQAGFRIKLAERDGANMVNTNYYPYTWIAIGPKP